jgi:hypothetical protein
MNVLRKTTEIQLEAVRQAGLEKDPEETREIWGSYLIRIQNKAETQQNFRKCGKVNIYGNDTDKSDTRLQPILMRKSEKKTPWSESASELYLPSDCRLSAK